jgi:hypothetical protein
MNATMLRWIHKVVCARLRPPFGKAAGASPLASAQHRDFVPPFTDTSRIVNIVEHLPVKESLWGNMDV